MVVAVQQPRQKEDPLTTIMKGLQIAQGVLGIKQQLSQPDPGELTQKDILSLEAKGGRFVAPGTEGAGTTVFKTPMGERSFMIPEKKPEPMSEFQQKQVKLREDQLALEKTQAAAAQKANELKLAEAQREKLHESVTKFQEDKKVVAERDKFQKASLVNDLIASGDPIKAQIAFRQLFRISGDVGVIRAEDLRDLGADPSLREQVALTFNKWVAGEPLTERAAADIQGALQIIQNNAKSAVESIAESKAKRDASFIRGADLDDLLDSFDVPGVLAEERFGIGRDQLMSRPSPLLIPGEGTATGAEEKSDRDAAMEFLQGL